MRERGGTLGLAQFILSDLTGYRDNAACRADDAEALAGVLDAMLAEGAARATPKP